MLYNSIFQDFVGVRPVIVTRISPPSIKPLNIDYLHKTTLGKKHNFESVIAREILRNSKNPLQKKDFENIFE